MSLRIDSMGMRGSARTAEPWHLMRKVLLLLLMVVALTFGLVLLLQQGSPAPLLMFNLLADGSIGAVMGLGSRFVLRRRHWLVRALVSSALAIVGLVLLGILTDARSGIGPLQMELTRVNWLDGAGIGLHVPLLPGRSPTDVLDAAHTVIAMDVAWIALRAWRGGRRLSTREYEPTPRIRTAATASGDARLSSAHSAYAPNVRPGRRDRSRPMIRQRKLGRPVASSAIRPGNVRSRRRGIFRKRLAVQLAAYEEHRCPYCLQEIQRDDIRGSVVCPVCHTLHHKDCWDITGTCQVPHLNG